MQKNFTGKFFTVFVKSKKNTKWFQSIMTSKTTFAQSQILSNFLWF